MTLTGKNLSTRRNTSTTATYYTTNLKRTYFGSNSDLRCSLRKSPARTPSTKRL